MQNNGRKYVKIDLLNALQRRIPVEIDRCGEISTGKVSLILNFRDEFNMAAKVETLVHVDSYIDKVSALQSRWKKFCVPLNDYGLRFQRIDLKDPLYKIFSQQRKVEFEMVLNCEYVFAETVKCGVIGVEYQFYQVESRKGNIVDKKKIKNMGPKQEP